jgi:hypothetical protein
MSRKQKKEENRVKMWKAEKCHSCQKKELLFTGKYDIINKIIPHFHQETEETKWTQKQCCGIGIRQPILTTLCQSATAESAACCSAIQQKKSSS